MSTSKLPISFCHANCQKCGHPTEFRMFEPSGPGGDFETYIGHESGEIYRLDLGQVLYQGRTRDELMAGAIKKEGRLIRVPDEIPCKICGAALAPTNIPIDGEEVVDAYEL